MFTIDLQIRPGDCDGFGHINNGSYISYIEFALAEALDRCCRLNDWRADSPHAWRVSWLSIEYRQAATLGDALHAQVWLIEAGTDSAAFGCEIFKSDGPGQKAQSIVRSRLHGHRVKRASGQVVSIPTTLLADLTDNGGAEPRPFELPPDLAGVNRYRWTHTVMRPEVGLTGRAHPQAVSRWLEEGIAEACNQAGWPTERCRAEGFIILQMRHDTRIWDLPRAGEAITITSRLVDVRRFKGTWMQDICRAGDDTVLVRDHSTGIFVDAVSGRFTTAPEAITRDIWHGEIGPAK